MNAPTCPQFRVNRAAAFDGRVMSKETRKNAEKLELPRNHVRLTLQVVRDGEIVDEMPEGGPVTSCDKLTGHIDFAFALQRLAEMEGVATNVLHVVW